MRLNEIEIEYRADVFNEYSDDIIVRETDEWGYHSSIPLNGILAIGWLVNDDILIINMDGIHIYDSHKKQIIVSDYESSFKKYISDDNLTFFVNSRSETTFIFGLRGGGGNLLTKDNLWSLEIVDIAWNIKIPCLTNNRKGKRYFLELKQNLYEGKKYAGFSKSEKLIAIMGDGGVDVYSKKE